MEYQQRDTYVYAIRAEFVRPPILIPSNQHLMSVFVFNGHSIYQNGVVGMKQKRTQTQIHTTIAIKNKGKK